MFTVVFVISALVTGGVASTTFPPGCVYGGHTYHVGESFQRSPCEHCFCSAGGRTPCAIADCFYTPCADAIHDPTKCCPICPNGENCRHTDGTIIKKGGVYKPDSNTFCTCPKPYFGAPIAVLEEAKRDAMLHHAACNLVKKPGQVYYLYARESGQNYFSLLSPEEWGTSCPHEFVGAFKLEYDMSWTPFDFIERRSQDFALIDKVMNAQKAIIDTESPNFKGLASESRNNSSAKSTDVSYITGYDAPKNT